MKHTLLPVLFAAALTACASATTPDRTGGLSEVSTNQSTARVDTLSIRLGQSAVADGGRLEVRFDSKVADSRCPANATCVWQGDAHVRIVTRVSGGSSSTSELHSALTPQKVSVDRYSITMVGMTPYPGTGRDSDAPVLIVRVSNE